MDLGLKDRLIQRFTYHNEKEPLIDYMGACEALNLIFKGMYDPGLRKKIKKQVSSVNQSTMTLGDEASSIMVKELVLVTEPKVSIAKRRNY